MTNGSGREVAGSPLHAFRDSPPPAAVVEIELGAESLCSPLRPVSDDHYLAMRLGRTQDTLLTSLLPKDTPPRFEEYAYAMLIADGVGGSGAGEAASRLALTTLVHLVTYFGRWHVRINDDIAREVVSRAERFYRGVDSTLLHKSVGSSRLQTTLTATCSAGRDLFLVHVGHSRAYLLHNGELLRLTRDHTLATEHPGHWPVDVNVTARDLHHLLTETLGGTDPSGPRIDIDRCRLADGDLVLLCTNGLTDMVGEDQIAEVLRSDGTPQAHCATLARLAVAAGGVDDVTALAARYRIADP